MDVVVLDVEVESKMKMEEMEEPENNIVEEPIVKKGKKKRHKKRSEKKEMTAVKAEEEGTDDPVVAKEIEETGKDEDVKELKKKDVEKEVVKKEFKKESKGKKKKSRSNLNSKNAFERDNQSNVRQYVNVPNHLYKWSKKGECNEILSEVIQKSGVDSITFREERHGRGRFEVSAENEDQCRLAIVVLQAHMRNQGDIRRMATRKDELSSHLEATKNEMENGLRVEFPVPSELLGVAIGSGGANVKAVILKTGVDKIIIDDKQLVIRIVGRTSESVAEARRLMEFDSQTLVITQDEMEHLSSVPPYGRFNKFRDIQQSSRVINIYPMHNVDPPTVEIVGTKTNVQTALLLLRTDLDYNRQLSTMHLEETKISSELRKIDLAYGYRDRPAARRNNNSESSSSIESPSENKTKESSRSRSSSSSGRHINNE